MITTVFLPSEIAATVVFEWRGGERGSLLGVELSGAAAAFQQSCAMADCHVLGAFFGVRIGDWNDVRVLTQAISRRTSVATDGRTIHFSGSSSFSSVAIGVEDGYSNGVKFAEADFMRLAARWLGALRCGVLENHYRPSETSQADWWPQWTVQVECISECTLESAAKTQ
ncbi:MAG: hypothetical protein H0V43_12895 [Gemmatimonadales bacterium]|nr:hypothetical protein [Gemmatimonadales bacterium]